MLLLGYQRAVKLITFIKDEKDEKIKKNLEQMLNFVIY